MGNAIDCNKASVNKDSSAIDSTCLLDASVDLTTVNPFTTSRGAATVGYK